MFSGSGHGPVGTVTRGTTGVNRLRRADRWMVHSPAIRRTLHAVSSPLAVDVGYGAAWWTTVEWATRLRSVAPSVTVVGLEIDPSRIQPDRDGVHFELGGFELAGYRPNIVRAFNVLRQYSVTQVTEAWDMVCSRLAPGGLFVEGTCDELGRIGSWITLSAAGPVSLTLCIDSAQLANPTPAGSSPSDTHASRSARGLQAKPSIVAERLPKVLIHRNVPGEPIHELVVAMDRAWDAAAPFAPYGPRYRWREAVRILSTTWPVEGLSIPAGSRPPITTSTSPVGYTLPRAQRDCILTVPWAAVS